jgi:septum formation protein
VSAPAGNSVSPDKILVLASGSPIRANLLRSAGIRIEIQPPNVDESELKLSLKSEKVETEAAAIVLAEAKARDVSRRNPGRLVLGADQMLDCGGIWFDKPASSADARAQLLALKARQHRLISAAILMRDGVRLWHAADTARLTMRDFSDEFLADYLDQAGDDILASVGAYRLEGLGAQLFSAIEGDYFTILGLPLLPVLGILREHGLAAA